MPKVATFKIVNALIDGKTPLTFNKILGRIGGEKWSNALKRKLIRLEEIFTIKCKNANGKPKGMVDVAPPNLHWMNYSLHTIGEEYVVESTARPNRKWYSRNLTDFYELTEYTLDKLISFKPEHITNEVVGCLEDNDFGVLSDIFLDMGVDDIIIRISRGYYQKHLKERILKMKETHDRTRMDDNKQPLCNDMVPCEP